MRTPLGELIRRKRKIKGWTQGQLAQRLGMEQTAVSDWETGKSTPRDLPRVMKVLGITQEELRLAMVELFEDDPVVRDLMATEQVSGVARDALLTLYQEAVLAHRQRNNET